MEPGIKRVESPRRRWTTGLHLLVLLLLAACLIVTFGDAPGTFDVFQCIRWVKDIGTAGPFAGYRNIGVNYPPLSVLTMWVSETVGNHLAYSDVESFKVPLGLFTVAACLVVLARSRVPAEALLMLLITTPFGLVLGYYDVVYAPFLLVAFYAAQDGGWSMAGSSLAIAALTKWQPIILAPLFLVAAFRGRNSVRQFCLTVLPTVTIVACVLLLFGPNAIVHSLLIAMSDIFESGQGANVGWFAAYVVEALQVKDLGLQPNGMVQILLRDPTIPIIGWMMLGLRTLFYAWYLASLGIYIVGRRTTDAFLLSALSLSLVQFTWNTNVHENHLFVPMIAAFTSWQAKCLDTITFASIATIAVLNMILFYGIGDGFKYPNMLGLDSTVILALAEFLVFILVFGRQISACLGKHEAPVMLVGGAI